VGNEPVGLPAGSVAPEARARTRRYTTAIFRAPSTAVSAGLVVLVSALIAALLVLPSLAERPYLSALAVFLIPAFVSAMATPALAAAMGGRFRLRRSMLLASTSTGAAVPLVIVVRIAGLVPGAPGIPIVTALLACQGFLLWLRHMTLFGVSNPSHLRSLPASLLQPVLGCVVVFALYGISPRWAVLAALFLLLGFLASALLLRAADRPIRREFGVSGVSLLRPVFDHISSRDPVATASLEKFFHRSAIPAHLKVTLVAFRSAGVTTATVALPTVHPGPFAALGSSDLPRKLAERLGPDAGVVLVPHTPCNHDLDLPSGAEVEQVGSAADRLLRSLAYSAPSRSSPLLAGRAGSWARAQLLGDTVLLLVTQAPDPTDDIDYAVADRLAREISESTGLRVAVIDAHNSYIEDRGDITYGTPAAERLLEDATSAVAAARAAAVAGPIEAGVAARGDYSIGEHGIGPSGLRALVVRAAGRTCAYVLIDGNNLLIGLRAQILEGLRGVVDDAEVMTTDNHVVHEVDGSINAVGEKYPVASLVADVRALVADAVQRLRPVEVGAGVAELPGVPVLGPDATARLLTSLGDTFSMFTNAFVMTFLLLLASSAAILLAVP
jgi:putative membrane protein